MFLIFLISLVIYIIAGIMIYHNTYNLEQNKKIKLIIYGFIITLIVTFVMCYISDIGINAENSNYLSIARTTSILIFAPINAIVVIPYIGNVLNKYKTEQLSSEQVKKRFIILTILLVIIFIFEMSYIKDFQTGLLQHAVR